MACINYAKIIKIKIRNYSEIEENYAKKSCDEKGKSISKM